MELKKPRKYTTSPIERYLINFFQTARKEFDETNWEDYRIGRSNKELMSYKNNGRMKTLLINQEFIKLINKHHTCTNERLVELIVANFPHQIKRIQINYETNKIPQRTYEF